MGRGNRMHRKPKCRKKHGSLKTESSLWLDHLGEELGWRKQKNNDLLKVNVLERSHDYILVMEWKVVRSGSISGKPKRFAA